MKNAVYGVGINDANYPVNITKSVLGKQKHIWKCPFYGAWRDMMSRCYSVKRQLSQPTYVGCSVAAEWQSFMTFRAWMVCQPWEGNVLDKDIIFTGNKLYGPTTCVFVSPALNSFLTDSAASRGDWPIGVSWHKGTGKFLSLCRNPFTGKREYLGYFICPDTASSAWRKRKHEIACQYADMQIDHRVAAALRRRYAGS